MGEYNVRFGYPINDANKTGEPLPTQNKFHKSIAKYRLLAGGFGTGKTTSLCLEVIKECFKYPQNYVLLGRKDLPELKSTTLKELLDLLPEKLIVNHNKQDRVIQLINGSEIYYMNLDDSREAAEKIKSLNLGSCAIDQLEEIDENVFLAIQGRLRRQSASRNFFATCNPAGHDWVFNKWKKDPQPGYELFETITLENIYLPKDYVEELLKYPERWVKRFVYCSWDDFEGIVYNEFVEAKHKKMYNPSDADSHCIVMDYGFRNPTAIGFWAVDYDGVSHLYDEFYESGKLINQISEEIKKNRFWKTARKLADPSIFNTQRDGKSIADEFSENGIYFQPANNDVLQGIIKVNELFKADKITIGDNCQSWLNEHGGYKWKEIKPGQTRNDFEEPIKKNDHMMDMTRYFVNYIYTPIEVKTEKDSHAIARHIRVGAKEKTAYDF
jgi:PBSX family phage terminase large subunit